MKIFSLILLFWFIGCGANVNFDKLEAEGTIDHKIRFDLTNFERYFRAKCKKDFIDEYGYTPTETEIQECVEYSLADAFDILNNVNSEDL